MTLLSKVHVPTTVCIQQLSLLLLHIQILQRHHLGWSQWPVTPLFHRHPKFMLFIPGEMIQFWVKNLDIWANQLIMWSIFPTIPGEPFNGENGGPTSGETNSYDRRRLRPYRTWSNCTERTDSCHISECGLTRLGALHERKHFHIRGRKWESDVYSTKIMGVYSS